MQMARRLLSYLCGVSHEAKLQNSIPERKEDAIGR